MQKEKIGLKNKKGFTLIELLVVIAIIGLLSSVVLASLNSARAKARDAKRASDVHQIKLAMEYYYDTNGYYPSVGNDGNEYYFSVTPALGTALSPYLKTIPNDPLGAGCCDWRYVRGPVATNSYGLLIWYEKNNTWCGSGVNWQTGWWALSVPSQLCPF
jgi:type II secretion system protein G